MNRRHRASIRLPTYDYRSGGGYFITLVARRRACLFGTIEHGVMGLSDIGKIVSDEWTRTSRVRPYVTLDEYVIMPNHLHGILIIDRDHELLEERREFGSAQAESIGTILGQFKSLVTKRARAIHGPDVQILAAELLGTRHQK